MSTSIEERVIRVAEQVLSKQHYVSAIDIFLGMGLVQVVQVKDWQKEKVPYLEQVIQGSLSKLSTVMNCLHQWATKKGLKASETMYLASTSKGKKQLRFSKSGEANIERAYRTHYISPALSEKQQQHLQEKLDQPPELVVFIIGKNSSCSQCKKVLLRGSFLFVEKNQPFCLACAKLNKLEFLPRGDAMLTRRAKKYSAKFAVVVQFSRARKRYERQGILVEPQAIAKAMQK